MGVFVNNAGCYMFVSSINYLSSSVRKIPPYCCNFPVFDQHICILKNPFFFICPDCCILNKNCFLFGRLAFFPSERLEGIKNLTNSALSSWACTICFLYRRFIKYSSPCQLVPRGIGTIATPCSFTYHSTKVY